jgi:hypothetical protein
MSNSEYVSEYFIEYTHDGKIISKTLNFTIDQIPPFGFNIKDSYKDKDSRIMLNRMVALELVNSWNRLTSKYKYYI